MWNLLPGRVSGNSRVEMVSHMHQMKINKPHKVAAYVLQAVSGKHMYMYIYIVVYGVQRLWCVEWRRKSFKYAFLTASLLASFVHLCGTILQVNTSVSVFMSYMRYVRVFVCYSTGFNFLLQCKAFLSRPNVVFSRAKSLIRRVVLHYFLNTFKRILHIGATLTYSSAWLLR